MTLYSLVYVLIVSALCTFITNCFYWSGYISALHVTRYICSYILPTNLLTHLFTQESAAVRWMRCHHARRRQSAGRLSLKLPVSYVLYRTAGRPHRAVTWQRSGHAAEAKTPRPWRRPRHKDAGNGMRRSTASHCPPQPAPLIMHQAVTNSDGQPTQISQLNYN